MDTLIMVGQFVLSLSILIVLHECGHFFPAKWFKTRVEKFYLFFNPGFSLFKTQKGETEYGIGWLPLGGYVKISGMIDESFDKEQMEGPPQPWEFRSKPAWQRLIIMVGGVTVNFILGVFLFAMILWHWGEEFLPAQKATYGIAVDSMAYEMGLRDGDQILKVGTRAFDQFNPGIISTEVIINNARDIEVMRDGNKQIVTVSEDIAAQLSKQENQKRQLVDLRMPLIISEFAEKSPAKDAGVKPNDRIIGIGDANFSYMHEFMAVAGSLPVGPTEIRVIRNDRDSLNYIAQFEEESKLGLIRKTRQDLFEFESKRYGLGEAIPAGWNKSINFISTQIKAFGQIFKGKIKAKDSLGSFITIGKMYGTTWDWQRFWNLTAMLSILLGFINLLPIPALDGGHVMFLLWEVITGVKPSDRVLEWSTMAGFALLMLLMVYALGLDIWRNFFSILVI